VQFTNVFVVCKIKFTIKAEIVLRKEKDCNKSQERKK
jgi:hypothetical protein